MSEEIQNESDQRQNNEQAGGGQREELTEQQPDEIENELLTDSPDLEPIGEASSDQPTESGLPVTGSNTNSHRIESNELEPHELGLSEAESDYDQVDQLTEEAEKIIASNERPGQGSSPTAALAEASAETSTQSKTEPVAGPEDEITATLDELKPAIESLLFVADEPLQFKQLCKVLGDVSEEDVKAALDELAAEYDARSSGLEIREIAGGWRITTRPQNHEFIRKYLKSRPSARLSLPALETLAVIAYKQPVTIPEVLEIRGVSSSSAIKTLLEKRLIVTKGRKETVGRPMLYGTSKEFLIQFGLKDLSELPSIEDFEDLSR